MRHFTLLVTLLIFTALTQHAQSPLKQKLEMRIDSIGDAQVKVSMEMNASQWQTWLQSVGNNPALLKRNMERQLPGYFLTDYNLEKNDMERSFTFSFKAYGVCEVDKNGKWLVATDQKDPDVTQLSDRKYMMVYTDPASNLQQTQIIAFPAQAKNVQVEKDAFGKTQFEFDMDNPSGSLNFSLWGGILLCLIGGGWLVKQLL